ncbi:MAG: hypothetical protein OEZ68_15255 [Gammaproteobacteria bacterium]|nr:hypothetical protein [Gammaproteobacteria bacterium]MDH5802158.1 hypothetical protein [Gammaproteobacteria bacterium]
MFGTQELRLIRYAVKKTMDDLRKRQNILDPESDDAVEIANDLSLYSIILEKIAEKPEV